MDIEVRLRVTAQLCCDCIRNAAYYESGWSTPTELKKGDSDFWVNLNGNFLDMAVLSWCFLFGDSKAEFRWNKLIDNQAEFSEKMYGFLNCTEKRFEEYISYMRLYRDKQVAHRDRYLSGDPEIHFPDLGMAVSSASFLYSELLKKYPLMQEICGHRDLQSFYQNRLKLGIKEHAKALGELS